MIIILAIILTLIFIIVSHNYFHLNKMDYVHAGKGKKKKKKKKKKSKKKKKGKKSKSGSLSTPPINNSQPVDQEEKEKQEKEKLEREIQTLKTTITDIIAKIDSVDYKYAITDFFGDNTEASFKAEKDNINDIDKLKHILNTLKKKYDAKINDFVHMIKGKIDAAIKAINKDAGDFICLKGDYKTDNKSFEELKQMKKEIDDACIEKLKKEINILIERMWIKYTPKAYDHYNIEDLIKYRKELIINSKHKLLICVKNDNLYDIRVQWCDTNDIEESALKSAQIMGSMVNPSNYVSSNKTSQSYKDYAFDKMIKHDSKNLKFEPILFILYKNVNLFREITDDDNLQFLSSINEGIIIEDFYINGEYYFSGTPITRDKYDELVQQKSNIYQYVHFNDNRFYI
jgi:hypothetical protein